MRYQAHINVEWCNQYQTVKYLFKYINKGHDRVTAHVHNKTVAGEDNEDVNEVDMFHNCRYISPCEAIWRIFAFDIHYRTPAVQRLPFHLPDEQNVIFFMMMLLTVL